MKLFKFPKKNQFTEGTFSNIPTNAKPITVETVMSAMREVNALMRRREIWLRNTAPRKP